MTNVARSIMVMIVSRCMVALAPGNSMAVTVCACPLVKRARDRISTAIGVVRSPMPTRTGPVAQHVQRLGEGVVPVRRRTLPGRPGTFASAGAAPQRFRR